jgi:hypothetical protein
LARWQRMASAQESSNQMANVGSRRPKEKSRCGSRVLLRPTETSRRGNRRSRRPKEKSWRSNQGSCQPTEKSRPGNRFSRRPKEKSRRGNRVLRRPLEKSRHGNRVSHRPLGKSWHGNRWIAPASWKIVDCAGHLKIRGMAIGYRAGLLNYCGAAIGVPRRPLEKSRRPRNNQQRRRWPEETANPNRTRNTT